MMSNVSLSTSIRVAPICADSKILRHAIRLPVSRKTQHHDDALSSLRAVPLSSHQPTGTIIPYLRRFLEKNAAWVPRPHTVFVPKNL